MTILRARAINDFYLSKIYDEAASYPGSREKSAAYYSITVILIVENEDQMP